MSISVKALAPVAVAIVLAMIPAPAGLAQHSWYYFAIFAGVIVGLMLVLPGRVILGSIVALFPPERGRE